MPALASAATTPAASSSPASSASASVGRVRASSASPRVSASSAKRRDERVVVVRGSEPRRRADGVVAAATSSTSSSSSPTDAFAALEALLTAASESSGPSSARGWKELEGAWVLPPPNGRAAVGVVHFIGGAFVGASPQLTYRLLLESLSARGDLTIVATPYAIGFDHLRLADEIQFVFDRCVRSLGKEYDTLPVYGVGHSMGALMHALIGSRYKLPDRVGNVLISFNNKPATDAVPLFTPVVAPGLQNLSPLFNGISSSPLRAPARAIDASLRARAPPVVRELLPVLDQLEPVFLEVANGANEFVPKPDDSKDLVRKYYAVKRNLLLRFRDDTIDETGVLASTLTDGAAISESLDLSVKSLAGDHVRPCRQDVGADVPPELASPLIETGNLISGVADMFGITPDDTGNPAMNPLGALRSGFEAAKAEAVSAVTGGGDAAAEMRSLADDILAWMLPGYSPPVAGADGGGVEDAAGGVTEGVIVEPPASMAS